MLIVLVIRMANHNRVANSIAMNLLVLADTFHRVAGRPMLFSVSIKCLDVLILLSYVLLLLA